ncbi:SprT-like family-domain-containing protein [Clohesyomyces aquaticus]|uniref:SprT-like family-domain-containing protein n=1 Tax=Clohesyomyces aquaticus TaxID=1231657 RepID=A0A1Y2A0I8_9PLEO|nr:SprT-like family-domain-containing protein [Clohesyomyces aquaticus]
MARLRKSSPSDLPVLTPATTQRSTRTSPRKTLRESPSKRELRYNFEDNDSSFLVPKAPVGDRPKKQRVLRTVASNSRLLRKLSDESLATPEKPLRRRNRNENVPYLYSKELVRALVKRPESRQGKTIPVVAEPVEVQPVMGVGEEEEGQSILCGDKENTISEEKEEQKAVVVEEKEDDNDDDDEDEERIIDPRNRRRRLQAQIVESESESDSETENRDKKKEPVTEMRCRSGSLKAQAQPSEPASSIGMPPPVMSTRPAFRKGNSTIANWAQQVIDLTSSPPGAPLSVEIPPPNRTGPTVLPSSRPTSSYSNNGAAILQYSPTPKKLRSPRKALPISRPNTPPLPPASPSKLVSPSKKKNRIPELPDLRPSIDAFWSAEVVNNLNDQISPAKPLISPRKQKWLKELTEPVEILFDDDASFPSPPTSPRKKSQSPTKNDAQAGSSTVAAIRAQRKAFASTKHALAESFLTELDSTITGGKISELSRLTGGIKLVWSKTLKTTAGRANWRRETFRLRTGPELTDVCPEVRHHCSIELAEKVIDDEERLYNVLAHEYCHLTTFMVSNQRNNPHGAEFKTWARKVSDEFKHLGVEVTTKHSYKIEYKYVWECVQCGYEFKRHSKSIDQMRHSCGRCKGKLIQTKPTPRGNANGKKPGEKSEYHVFVKENFSRVKKELEEKGLDAQMGKVMGALGEQYRERREAQKKKVEESVDEVELAFEALGLEDKDV